MTRRRSRSVSDRMEADSRTPSQSGDNEFLGPNVVDRAIKVPEVLSMIFEHCSPKTLAMCARVQHSWEGPALTELWRDLPSFSPLSYVLGEPELAEDNGAAVCPIDLTEP